MMRVNITIAFFKNTDNSIIPWLIKWWTNSKYYHTEISINGKWVTSIPERGVVISDNPIYTEPRDIFNLTTVLTRTQYLELMDWINSKNSKSYDFTGIVLSQVLPARIDNPNRWFCSEIVTKILQLALIKKTYDVTPNMISPGKLAKLFGVEYE